MRSSVLILLLALLSGCGGSKPVRPTASPVPAETGIGVPPASRRAAAASGTVDAGSRPVSASPTTSAGPRGATARTAATPRTAERPGRAVAPPVSRAQPAARQPVAPSTRQPTEVAASPAATAITADSEPAAPTVEATARPARAPVATTSSDGAFAPNGRSCPPEAPIKGSRAHVYHTTASRTYATVQPVACFASTDDALAAGYRPARQ